MDSMESIELHTRVTTVSPVMTREIFAERSGLRLEQLRGQSARGNIPLYPLGRHRLINVAQIGRQNFIDAGFVFVPKPYVTPGVFHALSGVPANSIYEYLATGVLPLIEVGRLRMVDVKTLFALCLEYND